jgi:hypothetical protein
MNPSAPAIINSKLSQPDTLSMNLNGFAGNLEYNSRDNPSGQQPSRKARYQLNPITLLME